MGLSGWHVLILALVAVLVFGGSGRISSIMGDMAKGIKSFKDGLSEDEDDAKELTSRHRYSTCRPAQGSAERTQPDFSLISTPSL